MLRIKSLKSTPPPPQNFSYPQLARALRVAHLRKLSCMRNSTSEVRYAS